jgi:PAS domain S-box-containing protein
LALVAVAFGLARALLHFHLPQTFIAFALSAIAITFWYGGTKPGIVAAVLASVVRIYFFDPEINALSRGVYYLVFLIFALLMSRATRARNELEQRVAERTADLTRANEDLKFEIAQRNRTEAELRKSEAYLAEAQRLTHTARFALNIASRKIVHWSQEHFRLFGFDPEGGVPPLEAVLQRIHRDDIERVEKIYGTATREKTGYELEYRIILPNGTIRHIHMLAHPVFSASRDLVEYVGTLVDVTERKRADEERERLRQVEADLARIARVTTMGELTASLAHEVNRPLSVVVIESHQGRIWVASSEGPGATVCFTMPLQSSGAQ